MDLPPYDVDKIRVGRAMPDRGPPIYPLPYREYQERERRYPNDNRSLLDILFSPFQKNDDYDDELQRREMERTFRREYELELRRIREMQERFRNNDQVRRSPR